MDLLLIVNPAASSVSPRTQVLVQRALGEHHEVRVAETTRRDHATRLAEDAARNGVEGVVVLGGDGTLNEAANGIAGTECALIPLPGGSTNVFCRTLGLPDDPHDAVRTSLRAIDAGLVGPAGLGTVNGRYFLFHTGIGFDAAVVAQVERQGDLKRYLNHPLFIYAGVRTWFGDYSKSRKGFCVQVADGHVDDAQFVVCLNTDPYTYLGNLPLHIAPQANLDSKLAVVSITSLKSQHLGRVIVDALRPPPGLKRSRFVDVRTDLDGATITAAEPVPVQVDGDYIGTTSKVEFGYHPAILQLARTDLL